MGATLERGPSLDQIKTPACRTLGTPATSSAGDGTLYRSHHAARWSCQDAGAISARPRMMPRMTATPGTIPTVYFLQ